MRFWHAAVFAAALLLAAGGSSRAGDFAVSEILGFSADGRYFAFVETGSEDPSDRYYVTVHVVDLDSGGPVAGSPFVATGREDAGDAAPASGSVYELLARTAHERAGVRLEAVRKAGAALARLGGAVAPTVSVTDPLGVPEGVAGDRAYDAMAAQASWLDIAVARLGRLVVKVETSATRETACADAGKADARDFSLIRMLRNGTPAVVHTDRGQASARHCPARYGLAALHLYQPAGAPPRLVALVSYFPRAWEEPGRRYLAVPVTLPQ